MLAAAARSAFFVYLIPPRAGLAAVLSEAGVADDALRRSARSRPTSSPGCWPPRVPEADLMADRLGPGDRRCRGNGSCRVARAGRAHHRRAATDYLMEVVWTGLVLTRGRPDRAVRETPPP
ncbi:hypothetical protein HBB16_16810 [Pseudonocardia sp. MCCB 268]|nr:hypothetical protein [Pseudonocardia cytotoxica]